MLDIGGGLTGNPSLSITKGASSVKTISAGLRLVDDSGLGSIGSIISKASYNWHGPSDGISMSNGEASKSSLEERGEVPSDPLLFGTATNSAVGTKLKLSSQPAELASSWS